jgi:hypothetical protein
MRKRGSSGKAQTRFAPFGVIRYAPKFMTKDTPLLQSQLPPFSGIDGGLDPEVVHVS